MSRLELFPDLPSPFILSHRGNIAPDSGTDSGPFPENSMEAFQCCVDRKVSGIELDVHLCASGEAVVIHDSDLFRMTGVSHRVENLTWDQIQTLSLGINEEQRAGGYRIPLLMEVLSSFSRHLYFDIELKPKTIPSPALIERTAEAVQAHHLEHKVLVSSFNPFALKVWRHRGIPQIPTALIYSEGEGVPRFLQHGNGRFLVNCDVLKPHSSLYERSKGFLKGYQVVVWGDPIPEHLTDRVRGIVTDHAEQFIPTEGENA